MGRFGGPLLAPFSFELVRPVQFIIHGNPPRSLGLSRGDDVGSPRLLSVEGLGSCASGIEADDVDEAQEEEKEGPGDVELTEQRVETGAGDPNARADSRGHDGKAERGQREADGEEGVGDKNSSEEELSKGAKEFLQKHNLKMTDKTWE